MVENLRGLHGLSVRGEEDSVGETLLHELEAHEPAVHPVEGRAGELDHVHFHPVPGELVHERADQGLRMLVVVEGRVDEVHSEDPEGLLLPRVLLVP